MHILYCIYFHVESTSGSYIKINNNGVYYQAQNFFFPYKSVLYSQLKSSSGWSSTLTGYVILPLWDILFLVSDTLHIMISTCMTPRVISWYTVEKLHHTQFQPCWCINVSTPYNLKQSSVLIFKQKYKCKLNWS